MLGSIKGGKGPLVPRRVGDLALLSVAPHSAFPTPGGAVCQTWSPPEEVPARFHSEDSSVAGVGIEEP